ncbi:LONGEVITY ASSURANCE PROTEIN 1 [Encephalitozoon cuniculi GB-M1]|uniref:LONGEVITY ASSURANCE PROTEIN 1 n=2 Tax=Encephalitozoon cuniculi TaxID=6035 RepID=Q8SRA0_ENCCU|nr:sphingosine N-acyltransferase LAG1 [Encephalitozoon cuniculi GB-M1]AGE95098.1 longevity assurance protein 1 [Encephalitozoon cuniculi]KMV65664.1 TRAM protein transporter [Encephalitozoon cuniculi EcunIII-L]UYI27067.1 TLC domain-containing protein [Encephalitozoon cuniculi]CAD26440.1 LONGEVITY ASSURANCE PROTEIN 1 [Encephalitozoon cuniculi GB-M1]
MRLSDISIDSGRIFETHFRFPRDICLTMVFSLLITMVKNLIVLPTASALIKRLGLEKDLGSEKKKKFCISLWKAMFYSFTSVYGYFVIRSEPRAYTAKNLMDTWGVHGAPSKVLFFYHLEFSYYFVELFYLFSEHAYKDFLQMVTHHIVTMLLLFLSYHNDLLRAGVAIIVIHDISDPFLEIGKLTNYIHDKSLATSIFTCFAGIFIASRLGIYAFLLSLPIVVSMWEHGFSPSLFLIAMLLQGLQAMHIVWSLMIVRMARKVIHETELEDIRSIKTETSPSQLRCK